MSAVVLFLSESVVESLKGAYKLRKSYQLLHKLFDMIVAVEEAGHVDFSNEIIRVASPPVASPTQISEDADDVFIDATEDMHSLASPASLSHSIEDMPISNGNSHSLPARLRVKTSQLLDTSSTSSTVTSIPPTHSPSRDRRASFVTISTFHNIPELAGFNTTLTDHAIYSGTLMALGAIMLLISLLPPSLSRLLSIIGFRGSRSQALFMLWKASSQQGPFGALATFALGSYYGSIVQNSDIVSEEFETGRTDSGGATLERLHVIIADVRNRYPGSALWVVEEVRYI